MRASAAILAVLAASALTGAKPAAPELQVSYLHNLASLTGNLPLDSVTLTYDPEHREVWTVGSGVARVFNWSGMELFSFGSDPDAGTPMLVAPAEDGDLLVVMTAGSEWRLVRCNFRGELVAPVAITGAPDGFLEDFTPSALQVAGGKVYLASFTAMKLVILDTSGQVLATRDFAAELDSAATRQDMGLGGFSVAPNGDLLFTVPTVFTAYIAPADGGPLKPFGVKGSAPGKFGVIAAIARDPDGDVYVTDVLKSAVIVFDRNLVFLKEFGFRGRKPQNLVGPQHLVVADGRVWVTQRARRGVSVFQVTPPEPANKVSSLSSDPQQE